MEVAVTVKVIAVVCMTAALTSVVMMAVLQRL